MFLITLQIIQIGLCRVLFRAGSQRKCTSGQIIILSAGHDFCSNKVQNLIAGRLAQARISERQLSSSTIDPNSSTNRAQNKSTNEISNTSKLKAVENTNKSNESKAHSGYTPAH
jgi:hypothetical protein